MLQIEMRSLAEIRPYPGNPRMNDGAVDAVAASIREYGWRAPIVVDGDGVIVCGHTRHKAAQMLGLSEAPVHVARDLTPEQIKAFRLADNKTAFQSLENPCKFGKFGAFAQARCHKRCHSG